MDIPTPPPPPRVFWGLGGGGGVLGALQFSRRLPLPPTRFPAAPSPPSGPFIGVPIQEQDVTQRFSQTPRLAPATSISPQSPCSPVTPAHQWAFFFFPQFHWASHFPSSTSPCACPKRSLCGTPPFSYTCLVRSKFWLAKLSPHFVTFAFAG